MTFAFLDKNERSRADRRSPPFAIGFHDHVAFAGDDEHPLLAARMFVLRDSSLDWAGWSDVRIAWAPAVGASFLNLPRCLSTLICFI